MSDDIIIRVFDIVGPICTSEEDGQAIHDKIAPLLREGRRVSVSFAKVETIISLFLNAAIGQLYGELPEDRIRDLLSVREMAQPDLSLLKRVVDNAKLYFAHPEKFDEAWKHELDEEDEDGEE